MSGNPKDIFITKNIYQVLANTITKFEPYNFLKDKYEIWNDTEDLVVCCKI